MTDRKVRAMSCKSAEQQNLHFYKLRVKELEEEVAMYKKRLDDLRKAKSTTVTRREREILEVGGPLLGKRRESNDARVQALEKQIESMRQRHEEEIKQVQESASTSKPHMRCNHEEVIDNLRATLENLEAHSSMLEVENSDLKDRMESLLMELSIKEAKWCENEESLKLKLKQHWGEKYAEWMQRTEQKLEDLQQANNLMRTLLKKQGRRDGMDGEASSERDAGVYSIVAVDPSSPGGFYNSRLLDPPDSPH